MKTSLAGKGRNSPENSVDGKVTPFYFVVDGKDSAVSVGETGLGRKEERPNINPFFL